MISIYQLKPKFQQLLKPIADRLFKLGITPNQITIASIVLSLFIGIAFWFADQQVILFLVVPLGLFFRMALNALDGMMARTYNQQSKFGEVLNELGDIFSDLFIFFPLLKFGSSNMFVVAAFICLAIINEFSGLLGKVINGVRRYEGPMGKSDRAFLVGAYSLASYFQIITASVSLSIFVVANILLLVSTYIRIKKSLIN